MSFVLPPERVLEHVRSVLSEAMDEDEAGEWDSALELYSEVRTVTLVFKHCKS